MDSFLIARYEVTFAEWWEFLDDIKIHSKYAAHLRADETARRAQTETLPVVPVEYPIPRPPQLATGAWELPWQGRWFPTNRASLESPVVGVTRGLALAELHMLRVVATGFEEQVVTLQAGLTVVTLTAEE